MVNLQNQVKSVVNFFVGIGRSFTKHDVTQQIRSMVGPTENIRHNDVKPLVEQEIGAYPRVHQETHPAGAILYVPPVINKINHDNMVADSTKDIQSGNHISGNGVLVVPDARGSISIPASCLAHFNKTYTFRAVAKSLSETRLIPVTSNHPPKGTKNHFTTYRGRLRVTKSNLGISSTGQYFVRFENGEIVIVGN